MRFTDFGFHLAVLNSLLEERHLDASVLSKALAGINPTPKELLYDLDEEARRFKLARPRLHAIELPGAAVAAVKRVDFDGGNHVYMTTENLLGFDTGGESEYYVLHSLAGAQALTSLENLNLDSYGYNEGKLDLRPLARLPSLKTLRLSGHVTYVATLTTLPSLQRLTYAKGCVHADKVLARLQARGVTLAC